MFDLFRSRAKAVRILLIALLSMVALSMLVYLIPGAGTPMGDRSDQVVAEVGKMEITVQQVEQEIHNSLQNAKVPPEMVGIYIPQLIDQSIANRAVAYKAQELGFRVSDQDLANMIRSLQFGSLPPDQYRQYIEQNLQMTVADFENNLRLTAYDNALQMIAVEGSIVTPVEVEAVYRRQNEKIKFEYISLDPTHVGADQNITPEDLKSYFDKNKGFFPMPETRDVQLIIADQTKVGESIAVPDEQIQNYYKSHQDQYRTADRVHARHILLATNGKSDAEKTKIKAKAEDLLKQLHAGADFAKLAEKNSEDPGSAPKGGDLGWVVKGQMVKEFEEATFALKPKEISTIITTQYGFHIIQVQEKEAARLKTLEEVKPEILAAIRSQLVYDRMQALTDQARAELLKAPQTAEQIAAKLGLQFFKVDRFIPGNPLPELGSDPQMNTAISSMSKGEVSQVLQVQPATNRPAPGQAPKLVIATVTGIIATHPAELAEVESRVRATYLQQKGTIAVNEKAQKLMDALKSNGGDLRAAAKSLGLEAKTADFFSRDGAAEGIGPGRVLNEAFEKPTGTVVGPIQIAGLTIVGKAVDRQAPDMTKLAEQRDAIVNQLKSQKVQERSAFLQDSILSSLIQQGKIKKHQNVINQIVARYRT